MEIKGNIKLIIAIISIILVLIIGIVIIKINTKRPVEEIAEEPYQYFTISSLDEKIGVIDRKGNEIIKPEYVTLYIPNNAKDVFVCFKDENNYAILNSQGKDIFTEYNSVYPIVI